MSGNLNKGQSKSSKLKPKKCEENGIKYPRTVGKLFCGLIYV